MQPELGDLVDRRRGRAIKAIMRAAETIVYPHLPAGAATAVGPDFRRVVLEELNDLTDLLVQVFESTGSGPVNEHWLRLVEEMHGVLVGDQAT